MDFLIVGTGGFLGAITRYSVNQLIRTQTTFSFPIQTLLVNFLGCLTIGLTFDAIKNHTYSQPLALFVGVGFLGAFTTFSAFGIETLQLIKTENYLLAGYNIVSNLFLSLGGVFLGSWLAGSARI